MAAAAGRPPGLAHDTAEVQGDLATQYDEEAMKRKELSGEPGTKQRRKVRGQSSEQATVYVKLAMVYARQSTGEEAEA